MIEPSDPDGRPIDLLITTKFPSYLIRHKNKIAWLFHQMRELFDPSVAHGYFDESLSDDLARRRLIEMPVRRAVVQCGANRNRRCAEPVQSRDQKACFLSRARWHAFCIAVCRTAVADRAAEACVSSAAVCLDSRLFIVVSLQ